MKKLKEEEIAELRKSRFSVFEIPKKYDVSLFISADETVMGIEIDGVAGIFTNFKSQKEIADVIKTTKERHFKATNIAPKKEKPEEGIQDLSYLSDNIPIGN